MDAVLHAVAHAPKAALTPALSSVTRDDFLETMSVSAYSLLALTRRVAPLMHNGGSVTALTFLGGERVRLRGAA